MIADGIPQPVSRKEDFSDATNQWFSRIAAVGAVVAKA
jgi:hypothetical protein